MPAPRTADDESVRPLVRVARRSFSEKTEEGRAYLQSRIALFAKVMFLLMAGYFAFAILVTTMVHFAPRQKPVVMGLGVFALVGLGSMWLYMRGKLRSPRMVALMDVGCVSDPGLLLGISMYLFCDVRFAPFAAFVGITFMIFGRALIVPSTAARTALASVLGVLPVFAAAVLVAFVDPQSLIAPAALQISLIGAWSAIAVVLATFGSSVLYGLREQVREAKQLGQYTLVEKIGEGGMGTVYRARHAMLRRPTAIKLLPPEKAGEQQLARFEREVQHTAELTHPNTVAIYDYGRSPDDVFYYAMELLDGVDLETLVERFGPQPPARVVRILRQACGALAEAHERGLVHRDIKPANIFLCHRGGMPDVVKVLDFGLVKEWQHRDAKLTGVDVVSGTPAFLSPEAITAPDEVGPAADLYGLGAVGYYLLCGEHVFDGATVVEVCGHHVHSTPVPPSKRLGRAVPAALEQLVLRCLAKNPAERPASARALDRALDGALAELDLDGSWSDERAEAWWASAQERLALARSGEVVVSGLESTVEVDLRQRGAGG